MASDSLEGGVLWVAQGCGEGLGMEVGQGVAACQVRCTSGRVCCGLLSTGVRRQEQVVFGPPSPVARVARKGAVALRDWGCGI